MDYPQYSEVAREADTQTHDGTSCELLINQIANPERPMHRVILQPRLVVRESCGAARAVAQL